MSIESDKLGRHGEELAAQLLQDKGLELLERNFRFKRYEIDLIARDKDTLVFVEVKSVSTFVMGIPEYRVDIRKQQKIIKAAQAFLQMNDYVDIDCRFDVVTIIWKKPNAVVKHYQDAFWA